MSNSFIKKLGQAKNLKIAAAISVAIVAGSVHFYLDTLNSIKTSSLLTTGVNTCFQRVSQTFTSLVIADKNSAYLEDSFTSLTGECFAEFTGLFQASHLADDKSLAKKINTMTSDVHWFQRRAQNLQKINAFNQYNEEDWFEGESETNADSIAVKKFEELEIVKDEILDVVEYNQAQAASYTSYLASLISIFSLILFGIGFYAYRRFQESFKFIASFEKWASDLLQKGKFNDSLRVEQLLGAIFDRLNMKRTKELFFLYHESVLERLAAKSSTDRLEEVDSSEFITIVEDEPTVSAVQSEIEDTEPGINISHILGDVIDMQAERAFTHGILIDLDVDEDLIVKGQEDLIQQVLFSTLSQCIDNSLKQKENRKITIRTKTISSNVYLKLNVSGHRHSAEELSYINRSKGETTNVNLMLVNELLKDAGGKLIFKNHLNQDGDVSGSSTDLLFDRAYIETVKEETPKKLVSVKKGKKKDILKEMSN